MLCTGLAGTGVKARAEYEGVVVALVGPPLPSATLCLARPNWLVVSYVGAALVERTGSCYIEVRLLRGWDNLG